MIPGPDLCSGLYGNTRMVGAATLKGRHSFARVRTELGIVSMLARTRRSRRRLDGLSSCVSKQRSWHFGGMLMNTRRWIDAHDVPYWTCRGGRRESPEQLCFRGRGQA